MVAGVPKRLGYNCLCHLCVIALRFISLSLSTALAATGQVFVPLLSWLILKERISVQKALGMVAIIVGIIVFTL